MTTEATLALLFRHGWEPLRGGRPIFAEAEWTRLEEWAKSHCTQRETPQQRGGGDAEVSG